MADQPALGPDGQLLDATKIVWYNDPDDAQPIQPTVPTSSMEGAVFLLITLGTTNSVFFQVNAHAQSERLQVHGWPQPLLRRNLMNLEIPFSHLPDASHTRALSNPGALSNASGLPRMMMSIRLMWTTKTSLPLLSRMDQMATAILWR